MKKIYVTIIIVWLSFVQTQAQENPSNNYIPENIAALKVYLHNVNKARIDAIEGKFSSKIKKAFKKRDEKMVEAIEDSAYFFSKELDDHLSSVLKKIYVANPQINAEDFYFFVRNSMVPNAGSYGDGTFEVNLGLFTNFESEDELAFVLCHEIAHQLLQHSLKRVTKRVIDLNSKETRKKVREIKSRRYGQTKAGLSLLDELNIDMLDHSRDAEVEADSLGYLLFSKTGYKKSASMSSLLKLKKVDDMVYNYEVKLDSIFNFEGYSFKPHWLEEEISLFDIKEEINDFQLSSDTLKTHPELQFRVDRIKNNFKPDVASGALTTSLSDIHEITVPQSVQFTIDLKFLDLSIYQLVHKFNNKIIDADYYYTTMAKVLERVYIAKRDHKLGKHVPHKNSFSDEKVLNQIRLFLHNLELTEIKEIGLAFCGTNQSKITNHKKFESIYQFFKNLN
ncbi:M48 family metalloprotease [Aquimarina gracilis]|uniref:M48 family metalloprotease n=1 Tax=Aquimarina gracilis TaxID=874422 RepID=A0ABU5ZWX5_9FLAO|nr:M48 family metalloprotease [Aquimarina gracilis]MEB3346342.1 M48 family metalloprotease [Aquimarina gracilis]